MDWRFVHEMSKKREKMAEWGRVSKKERKGEREKGSEKKKRNSLLQRTKENTHLKIKVKPQIMHSQTARKLQEHILLCERK